MAKPVTQADEPTLFPREWVIGRAAADLVREDEGVLLDQPWMDPLLHGASAHGTARPADPYRAQAPEPARPATSPRARRPTSVEIAELKLGQARLQRRFEAARMRPRPCYAGVSPAGVDPAPVMMAEAPRQAPPGRPFPWRRLAILLVLAALASGLYQYRAVFFQL